MTRPSAFVVVMVLLASHPGAVQAQPDQPRYDPVWHASIGAAGFLGAGLLVWLEPDEHPTCRWCGIDDSGSPTAPRADQWARRHLRWQNTRRAANLSQVTVSTAYAWPLVALAAVHGGAGAEWGRDQSAALSSVGLAQLAADAAKRGFRRSRPAVVFDQQPIEEPDDVHSFISGHTATSFAAVVAAGTIASRRDSRDAPWIWSAGIGLAATTSYLRIAGDRHFLTDVLAGAAVGSALGLLMPQLFDDDAADATAATRPAATLIGFGPAARLAAGGSAPIDLRVGAGPRSLGVVGSLAVR